MSVSYCADVLYLTVRMFCSCRQEKGEQERRRRDGTGKGGLRTAEQGSSAEGATVERREQARTGRVIRDAGRGRREAVNFPNGRLWLEEG